MARDLGLRPREDHAQGRRPDARAPRRDFARSWCWSRARPIAEARAEVITSADIIEWYAEEGRRSYGRIVPGRGKVRQLVVQEPVGVVAAFTPWNFPVLTPARKIGGALAAGCSLILKASEETPGACVEMVRCFADAGLPAGVLNLVFGVPSEVSEHLLAKDAVRKISFTGSIPVGKHLAALAAKTMKRTTMELGGHSPVVVFADADPEKAADTIAAFKYRNAGQVCISPTRFYVQEDVYHALPRALHRIRQRRSSSATAWRRASPWARWPMRGASTRWRRFVADAKNRGGKIATGGKRRGNQGYFYRADRDHRRARRFQDHDAGAVRPAGAGRHVQDLRRSGRARQLAALRACRLRLHHVELDRGGDRRRDRVRHGRRQLDRRSRRRRRRSAASRNPATAAKAASRGSAPISVTKFISQALANGCASGRRERLSGIRSASGELVPALVWLSTPGDHEGRPYTRNDGSITLTRPRHPVCADRSRTPNGSP